MKYKFQVVIPLTYSDTEIEVEVDLTNEEVSQIKEVIANNADCADESLLPLLSNETPELYDKFGDAIFHPLFLELLIDGVNNYGCDVKLDEDDIEDYREADFDKVFAMYGDHIEIDLLNDCKCKIPEEWLSK